MSLLHIITERVLPLLRAMQPATQWGDTDYHKLADELEAELKGEDSPIKMAEQLLWMMKSPNTSWLNIERSEAFTGDVMKMLREAHAGGVKLRPSLVDHFSRYIAVLTHCPRCKRPLGHYGGPQTAGHIEELTQRGCMICDVPGG